MSNTLNARAEGSELRNEKDRLHFARKPLKASALFCDHIGPKK